MTEQKYTPNFRSNDNLSKADILIFAFAGLGSVIIVIWTLLNCRFGYDFSDEGSYLVWISNPAMYKASASQYGFFYHPIFILLNRNIIVFRQVNLVLIVGLAWTLCTVYFWKCRLLATEFCSIASFRYHALAGMIAVGSLAYLEPWLPTPNYRTLALQGLLAAGIGMVLAERVSTRISILGWVIIGLSGAVTFLAKPTTGASLAVLVALYSVASGKLCFRMAILSAIIAAAGLLVSALIIDGSIYANLMRYKLGVHDSQLMGLRYGFSEVLRFDRIEFARTDWEVFGLMCSVLLSLGWASCSNRRMSQICSILIATGSFTIVTFAAIGAIRPSILQAPFQRIQYLTIPVVAVLTIAIMREKKAWGSGWRRAISLAGCFLFFPYAFALGSTNNYWETSCQVAFFWVFSGIVICVPMAGRLSCPRALLPMSAAIQLGTTFILCMSVEHPYRQVASLSSDSEVVTIPPNDVKIAVSYAFAKYIHGLQELGTKAGFTFGTPIIDLTGHYPGALYIMGASSIGRAWMIGGDRMVSAALERVPCKSIARAWILTEPGGPCNASAFSLVKFGIDLRKDYIDVGVVKAPPGAYPKTFEQHLLKPKRGFSEGCIACEEDRGGE